MSLPLIALLFVSQAIAQPAPSKPQYSSPHLTQQVVSGFIAPVKKPDYTTQILQPLQSAQTSREANCAGQGGSLSGVTCVLPPPPPPATYTEPINSYSAPVYAIQSESWYKAWIYNEESGNNPARWNTSGCLGIGQACPASKLLAVCPNEDYGCEDAFFTQYMQERYGSWQAAYEFHIAHGWW